MTAAEAERQLVVFSLHGERYGLPITAVREIIRYIPPSATATARGVIQGMISLRGRTLPIVDLSSRLGQQLEVGAGTRILVLEVPGGAIGLIVDGVDGILPVPAVQIEPLPLASAGDGLGEEIAAVGDRLIVLIDPEQAFGDLLPRKAAPARRRRTSSARPRASS
jgi:purine-binding chemotaxis protein CheW